MQSESPSGKHSKKNPAIPNHEWFRTLSVISCFAYELDVAPSAPKIRRALLRQEAILKLGVPECTDEDSPEFKAWEKRYEETEKATYPVDSSNTYSHMLRGARIINKNILNGEIKRFSQIAYNFYHDVFWRIYASQPTAYSDYYELAGKLQYNTDIGKIPGVKPHSQRAAHPEKPTEELLTAISWADSVNGLGYFLLLLGTAREFKWNNIYDRALNELSDIACRMASVTPFELCGADFVSDLLFVATGNPRYTSAKWMRQVTERIDINKKMIRLAYRKRILITDRGFTQSYRWDELALLRFAAERKGTNLLAVLTLKGTSLTSRRLFEEVKHYIVTRRRLLVYLF